MISKRIEKKFADNEARSKDAIHRKNIAVAGIKEQQAEIERLKKEKLLGSLVPIGEVEEVFLGIGAKTKSQLARLVSELPPKLEGLEAIDMIQIIRDAVDEVCLYLAESFKVETPIEPVEAAAEKLEEDDLSEE